jgi:hypothetical protein
VCTDVAAVAQRYERLFDQPASAIAEGLLVATADTPIAVMTEGALARRLPRVRISARPAPAMAALFIRVTDRDAAAAALQAGGLAPARMPDGSIALGADVAHGVAIVFG